MNLWQSCQDVNRAARHERRVQRVDFHPAAALILSQVWLHRQVADRILSASGESPSALENDR
jgi:hypothetical protein